MHKSRSIRTVRATQIPCDRRDGPRAAARTAAGVSARRRPHPAMCVSGARRPLARHRLRPMRFRHPVGGIQPHRPSAQCALRFRDGAVDGCFEGGAPALFGKAAQAVHGLSRARRAAVGGFVRRAGTTGMRRQAVKRSRGSMVFRRDVPHAVFAAAWPLAAMRFGTRQKASRSGFRLGRLCRSAGRPPCFTRWRISAWPDLFLSVPPSGWGTSPWPTFCCRCRSASSKSR